MLERTQLEIMGLWPPHPLVDLDDIKSTSRSLTVFIARQNSGKLQKTIAAYKKDDASLPEGQFLLSTPSSRQTAYIYLDKTGFSKTPSLHIDNATTGAYYADGKFGFALGFRPQKGKTVWLAATTFCISRDIPGSYAKRGIRANHFSSAPVIVQLQACEPRGPRSRRVRPAEILSLMRWEKILVATVVTWAQENRLPAVYVLPGELNSYCEDYKRAGLPIQRARMRYNVTAERMGFIKEANGLFALHLAYSD